MGHTCYRLAYGPKAFGVDQLTLEFFNLRLILKKGHTAHHLIVFKQRCS